MHIKYESIGFPNFFKKKIKILNMSLKWFFGVFETIRANKYSDQSPNGEMNLYEIFTYILRLCCVVSREEEPF